MFKKRKFILFAIAFLAVFSIAVSASAQTYGLEYSSILELGTRGLKSMVFAVINAMLGFLGVLAITLILYGGFLWMTSGGVPEKVNKAKRVLISAVIGLLIILASFAITQFILNSLTEATGGGGGMAGSPCDCILELGTCAAGGCLRCQNTINPLVCAWQSDPMLTCPGCPGAESFIVTSIQPPDENCPFTITNPMNSVIRIYFNKNVDPASVDAASIIIQGTGVNSQCAGGALNLIVGNFTVSGKIVEFSPLTGTCTANPCGADRCFDDNSTIDIEVIIGAGGVQSAGGLTLQDNIAVNEHPQFFTNNLVDCQPPTVNLISQNQVCLNTPNNLGSSATDDSGVSQVEFSDNNGSLAFLGGTPTVIIPCPGPGLCGNPLPWILPSGTAIWQPTVALGYSAGIIYSLTAEAADLDSNTTDDTRSFSLRAAHCCDSILNADEIGIDCGGVDCAACVGSACDIDIGDPLCNCDDSICASGICDCQNFGLSTVECEAAGYPLGTTICCLCQDGPIIDCITPNDSDSCSPHGIPVGTAGNLVSIWGRNFGAYGPSSQITINGIAADLANTVNAQCISVWTDRQIIAVVPIGVVNGPIEVTADSGYSDATNDARGTIIPDFFDDGTVRPGLCKVENIEAGSACLGSDCGFYEESIRGHGLNILAGSTIEFGNDSSNIAGLNSVPNPDLEIDCQIPNIQSGDVGFRAVSAGGDYGNYLNFRVTNSPTGPRIDYIEPNRGPEGQYVTIYGSGFTNSHAGNTVTFNGTAGDFSFPSECGVDYWSANSIIVKVPAGAADGDVIVTIGTEDSNGKFFDVCVVGAGCELLPGMCKIAPVFGPINTLVDIYGEHFGALLGDIEFYDGTPAFPNISAGAIGGWSDIFINNAQVPGIPTEAQSGPVYVLDNSGNRSSNSIPFEIGDCAGNNANCPDSATQVCCPDGACYVGACPTANFSTYTWSFTTGDYFMREECDTEFPYDPVVPSPTPWIGRAGGNDVCVNAAIGASFSEVVSQATVNNANVLVQECADSTCIILGAPIAGGFIYHPFGIGIEAFEFHPAVLLNQNSWHQITLIGSAGGITTAAGNPLIDDFVWHFKTRDDLIQCEIGEVVVNPNPAKLVMESATQDFIATLISKDNPCIIINVLGQSMNWSSDDPLIATVSGSATTNETVSAIGNGNTYIRANAMPDNKTGKALLKVDFQGLSIIEHWYECDSVCINAEMGLRFDGEVNSATLTNGANGSIRIYDCGGDSSCPFNPLTAVINITNPFYLWNNFTGESVATFSAVGNFTQDNYYRAVIKTGENGVKSVLGDYLIKLNSNLASGEECDGDALCGASCLWNGAADHCGQPSQECYPVNSVGCSVNCLNTGSVTNTCGNGGLDIYENCDDNNTNSGDGCSSECLYEGSTGTAVCGNSILEFGEACDDGNQTNGDGCSDKCLKEGSTGTAVCGNGAIELGEDCDDNNIISSDGCSSICLSEGVKSSVCGDRDIGIGEDCDDGNLINNDGCSNICLNEGSSGLAVCGDGAIETNGNDSYSWIFKTKSGADALCALSSVEVIPTNASAYIGDVVDYKSIARSSPDSCDPSGQTINPLNYNWNWWSNDGLIADLAFPLQDIELPNGDIDPYQQVDAISLGTTNINAQADGITGSGIITVIEPTGPGVPCILGGGNCCQEGVSSCMIGYGCMEDSAICPTGGVDPNYNNCFCCCDMNNDQCFAPLECTPNIDACVGNSRGWCCGCEQDADCSAPLLCGNDTCCRTRPVVIPPTMPVGGNIDVCRNVLISAEFDQEMKGNSIKNEDNMEVITEYTVEGICPTDTSTSTLYSFAGEVWCAIDGSLTVNSSSTIVYFAPKEDLNPATIYRVIIKGDPDLTDAVAEGVLSEYGIAMDGDYSWNFTTGDIICDIDYIRVDVEVGDSPLPNLIYEDMSSDIFLCAGKNDCIRDSDGGAAGNQHQFYSFAVDDSTGNILNPNDFDWTWTEIDSDDIFQISTALGNAVLTANPINGKAILDIKAVSNGVIDYGSAKKKMTINTFMCENPWPDISYWPWEDWILNNPTADCDIAGICNETYFDMFYCRDDGGEGTDDDFPAISIDPVIRSENGDILKEIFFLIEE